MAEEKDPWPEGLLPVTFTPSTDDEFGGIFDAFGKPIVEDYDETDGALPDEKFNAFAEKAARAINAHDKLVEACGIALLALLAHTGEEDGREQDMLRAALAAARKPEEP